MRQVIHTEAMRGFRGIVLLLAAASSWSLQAASIQTDRSMPPAVEATTGGFTLRRLTNPVTIDGRNWIAVIPMTGAETRQARNGAFRVSLSAPNDQGDVRRFTLTFADRDRPSVLLTPDVVSYALLTNDSRWIVFEPIEVIDVRAWRRYALSTQFGIQPYVLPKAISADGERLLMAQSGCASDCRNAPIKCWEIRFPASGTAPATR